MTNFSDQIANRLVHMSVDVQRYAATLRRRVLKQLQDLESELIAELAKSNPTGVPRTAYQQARLETLLASTRDAVQSAFTTMEQTTASGLQGLSVAQASRLVSEMNGLLGGEVISFGLHQETMAALAGKTLIQGAPSSEWWSRQTTAYRNGFMDQMRTGVARGETLDQLVKRIRGAAEDSGSLGAMTTRNLEALVRTSAVSLANTVHMQVYKANDDVIKGVQWVSTLDTRTTAVCRGLDGLEWDLEGSPIGHGIPFPGPTAHWGCRSTQIPITKSWEELAQEADGDTELASRLDQVPDGTRASMDGQVAGNLSYKDWLEGQPESVQRDVLGPGRFELWKQDKLSLPEMLDQRGNPLPLSMISANSDREQLDRALFQVESRIMGNARESAYVFAPDGTPIFSKQGGRSSVSFTSEEVKHFRGNVITHNHPRGSSFSIDDVKLASTYGAAEIRAAGKYARYSIQPGPEGWDAKFFAEKIAPLYKAVDAEMYRLFSERIRAGDMSADLASITHAHEVWTRVAKALGLIYERIEWLP